MEESLDRILDSQVKNFSIIIDDYLDKYPNSFTRENRRLWEIFKHHAYSVQEMMQMMGIADQRSFYAAKARLADRIIIIYGKAIASKKI